MVGIFNYNATAFYKDFVFLGYSCKR